MMIALPSGEPLATLASEAPTKPEGRSSAEYLSVQPGSATANTIQPAKITRIGGKVARAAAFRHIRDARFARIAARADFRNEAAQSMRESDGKAKSLDFPRS